jgi:hypothetical protein
MMKTLAAATAGAAFAVVLVVACSDDSPGDADAAVCDCPASEPPLASRVMRVRGDDATLVPGGATFAVAQCPTGAVLLNGWCAAVPEGGTRPEIAIVEGGASPVQAGVWSCRYENYSVGGPNTIVHAEAVCLMPAQ